MLKIRLQRTGRTNDTSYRLIVTPNTYKAKTQKSTEVLGSYNVKKGEYNINEDRVKYWLSVGAQISPTVKNLLIDRKIVTGNKVRTQSKKVKKEAKKK
jgi:small subunit ribosomal protein S16